MKRVFKFIPSLVLAILVLFFAIYLSIEIHHKREFLYFELGTKISSMNWLYRLGEVSDEELKSFEASSKNLSLEEQIKLLDEILDGKEPFDIILTY